jgi:hypothetical protein
MVAVEAVLLVTFNPEGLLRVKRAEVLKLDHVDVAGV